MNPDHIETETYVIEDPRPTREANPYSFYLPCRARLDALAAEDHVKAVFLPKGDDGGGERMWLRIDRTEGDRLHCTLMNQPFGLQGLTHGDRIEIARHHVIQIDTDRQDDPPETNDNDRFFERCLVDERIVAGAPVHRIVRDEPEPDDYHGSGRFGWSGWRFEAEGYGKDTPAGTYALVVPLRVDHDYADLLDSPDGTELVRVDGVWTAAGTVH